MLDGGGGTSEEERLQAALELFGLRDEESSMTEDAAQDPEKIQAALDWLLADDGSAPRENLSPSGAESSSSRVSDRLEGLTNRDTGARFDDRVEIGRGGMGAILRVFDRDLRRTVAMKVALDGRSQQGTAHLTEHALSRFIEEAQVTSQLDHPGVVPVHELGLGADGRVYFTMKLVKGKDLRKILQEAQQPDTEWNQARLLGVLLKVCEAMAYAHDKGVVHRDLKPANIMVGHYGEVYVMDWGLARTEGTSTGRDIRVQEAAAEFPSQVRTDRGEARQDEDDSPLVTMDGAVVGTPYFMPPEQARGDIQSVGPRSDVYSAGAILYCILTGRAPYKDPQVSSSPRMVLARVKEAPPTPVEELCDGVNAELVSICEKAMARDPRHRYQAMGELAEDLRASLEGRVVAAHEAGLAQHLRKWVARNRALAGALALAGLSLLAGSWFSLHQRNIALDKAKDLQEALAAETAALTTAMGNQLAAKSHAVGESYPTLALLLGIEAERLAPGVDVAQALYTAIGAMRELHIFHGHDGAPQVGAVDSTGRYLHSADNTGMQILWDVQEREQLWFADVHTGFIRSTGFCDDGRLTFSASEDGSVRVWETLSGEPVSVHSLGSPILHAIADEDRQRIYAGLGDGRVVSLRPREEGEVATLGTHEDRVIRLDTWAGRLATLGDDHRLQVFDLAQGTRIGGWDVSQGERMGRVDYGRNLIEFVRMQFTHDGRRVFASRGDMYSSLWEVETGTKVPIPPGRETARLWWLSPDRKNVALERALGWSLGDGGVECWPLDGGGRLGSFPKGRVLGFSGDGENIFRRSGNTGDVVDLLSATGTDSVTSLVGHRAGVHFALPLPGGRTVTSSKDRTIRLWSGAQKPIMEVSNLHGALIEGFGRHGIFANLDADLKRAKGEHVLYTLSFHSIEPGSEGVEVASEVFFSRGQWTQSGNHAWISVGADEENRVLVWGVQEQRILLDYRRKTGPDVPGTHGYSLSEDGSRLAISLSGGIDQTRPSRIEVRSVETGEIIHSLAIDKPAYLSRFSPDGRLLAVAHLSGGSTTLWDVEAGELLHTFEDQKTWVLTQAFSPDGRKLATFGVNVPLRIYDVETFELLQTVPEVPVDDGNMTWSPDSRAILVHSKGHLGYHNTETGSTIAEWRFEAQESCLAAGFSEDGEELWYYLSTGQMTRLPTDPVAYAKEIAPRRLTAEEMAEFGIGTPEERQARADEILRQRGDVWTLSDLARRQIQRGELSEARKTLDHIVQRRARSREHREYQAVVDLLSRAVADSK